MTVNWVQPPIPPLPNPSNTWTPPVQTATGPFVLGIVGTALGLIPLLCYPAFIVAVIGLVLGVVSYRSKPRKRLARAAIILSIVGICFSIAGMFIMNDIANDLETDLNNIFVTTTR